MADSVKVVAKNSKAYHDYFIEDKYEAGIELAPSFRKLQM